MDEELIAFTQPRRSLSMEIHHDTNTLADLYNCLSQLVTHTTRTTHSYTKCPLAAHDLQLSLPSQSAYLPEYLFQ